MNDKLTIEDFTARYESLGYTVTKRTKDPEYSMDIHTHDFRAVLWILDGRLDVEIKMESGETHRKSILTKGSLFEINSNVPHTERCYEDGVTYMVAYK